MAMAGDLFNHFSATGEVEQKTIIFCVNDRHADAVAIEMNNLYARWCAAKGEKPKDYYAFKCTAKSSGNDYLPDLKGSSRSHFVATTVDLLTTGVDVPNVRNIVFFKYVNSPISFYQMVGRGTRLDVPTNKLMFRVYDYTNATRLFGEKFLGQLAPKRETVGERREKQESCVISVEGFEVNITPVGRYILTTVAGETRPITVEEYRERLAESLVKEVTNLTLFRSIWVRREERGRLLQILPDGGRSATIIRTLDELEACDLFDVLGELGYGLHRLTRQERTEAFYYKQKAWLKEMPRKTAATVQAFASQFAKAGTEGLENRRIFEVPEVSNAGGLEALKLLGKPFEVIQEIKVRLFAG
jgi:type I restriction enzyme R subunit